MAGIVGFFRSPETGIMKEIVECSVQIATSGRLGVEAVAIRANGTLFIFLVAFHPAFGRLQARSHIFLVAQLGIFILHETDQDVDFGLGRDMPAFGTNAAMLETDGILGKSALERNV